MSHDDSHLPALAPEEPLSNPGLPAHEPRPTDVDPAAEARAERQIAALFGLASVCAVLFVVAYFTLDIGDNHTTVLGMGASTVALGSALGGALLLIGIGLIQWARKLMADTEIVAGMTTQMQVPKELKSVGVVVSLGGQLIFCQSYPVADGSVRLPSTLGVAPQEDREGVIEPVTVSVLGFRTLQGETRTPKYVIAA